MNGPGVADVRLLAGGDYLLAGSFVPQIFEPAPRYLAKVNASGNIDRTFNTFLNGTESLATGPHAFDLQADGKIIMASLFTSGFRRLNADLTIDSNFSPGTRDGQITAIKLTQSGGVLVGGFFNTFGGKARYGLAKLTAVGDVDDGFQAEVKYSGNVSTISVLSDGGVLASGSMSLVSGLARNSVFGINPSGSSIIDFGFASTGLGFFYPYSGPRPVTAILALRNGKSLIASRYYLEGGSQTNQIRRFNWDGSIDPSFTLTNGPSDACNTMVEQPDGRVVIGGDFLSVGGSNLTRIARLETSGAIDAVRSTSPRARGSAYAVQRVLTR